MKRKGGTTMRWKKYAKSLNCVLDWQEFGWDTMIAAVSAGQFDMATDGITITAERDENADFSDGYIATEQRMLVRLDEARFFPSRGICRRHKSDTRRTDWYHQLDTAVNLVGEIEFRVSTTLG
ncbi:MAG: hypothetical protein CM1200mP6_08810 [Anaerolineaceae bacterium]|nr:MAG: hypothetical protein CM1200mP6_08810 [Anaerolineaceae bacterium]